MKNIIKTIVLVAFCFGFTSQSSWAQLFTITSVTVPSNASSCTNTDISAFCQVNCNNFPLDSVTYSINNNVIDIGVYYQQLFICLGALAFPTHTANLGMIPGGSYAVNVTAYLNMGTSTNQTNTVSSTLNVTNCCNAIPGIFYSGNICKNDSILFENSGSGAISQEWYVDNVLVSTDSNFYYSFSNAGSYVIKQIVSGTGCVDSTSQTITVNDLPNFNLGVDTSFCQGDSILLSANNWASVLWSNGSTLNSTYFASAGQVYVEVTDLNGCSKTDTLVLTTNPEPYLEFGSVDTLICSDNFPVTISAAGPDFTYLWHDGSTDSVFTLNSTGWAACTVTNSGGCENYDSIFVIQLICSGLKGAKSTGVSIYPNPSHGVVKIYIEGKLNDSHYSVIDLNGALLRTGNIKGASGELNLSELPSGEYLIKFETISGESLNKIILK